MSTDALFDNVDDLLNASMEDIEDLPPVGAPPSGHYNLLLSMEKREVGEKDVICADFEITAINDLKEGEDPEEVKEGQKFTIFYHVTKKDGTMNKFGIGQLKELLKPFATHFGKNNIGELINDVKQMNIAAAVKRKVNRKNEDQYNLNIKDIVIL